MKERTEWRREMNREVEGAKEIERRGVTESNRGEEEAEDEGKERNGEYTRRENVNDKPSCIGAGAGTEAIWNRWKNYDHMVSSYSISDRGRTLHYYPFGQAIPP